MNTEKVVFERDNKQVIQEQNRFFARVFEDGEIFESQDFNTLEKAKSHLGFKPTMEDNNKLISEFMGYRSDGETIIHTSAMSFCSDWNWLMSVVDKIESIKDEENNGNYYVEIHTRSCMIFNNGHYVNEVVSTMGATRIEAVYQAVVEFINYYN